MEVRRFEPAGLWLEDEAPQGISRGGTAWVHHAEVTDLLEAMG